MVALTPIVPGQVVEIADGVRRITAPNPGMMTGPGTNTYIIGHDELIMVDPGPDLDAHRDVLLNAVGDRLRSIVCTHTHRDHSPLAVQIRAKTGAPVLGFGVVPSDGRQDEDFVPERALADGDMVECGNHRLRAVHTPGHASNHLCYLLEDRGILFTGDHVMQGSTVVISPPNGNMQAYFDSLDKVLGLPIQMFAPGHGFVIEQPYEEVHRLVAHRLAREAKILASLQATGPVDLTQLVSHAYAEVSERLHTAAMRSLHAHLIRLQCLGRVEEANGIWKVVD